MKKLIMTIAIVLGLSMTSFAQGGLFHRGANADGTPAEVSITGDGTRTGGGTGNPMLPIHEPTEGGGGNQPAPLGSGIALLTALGAGYVLIKRRGEE